VKKKILVIVFAVLILVALLQLDFDSVLHSMTQISALIVLLMFALQISTQLLINFQWYRISKIVGVKISYGEMFYANCSGYVIDSITPGVKFGGEATRAVQIKRVGNCTGEEAAGIVAVQKLFSMSALSVILIFSVGHIIAESPWPYFLLILGLMFFAVIFFMPDKIRKYVQERKEPRFSWMRKIRGFLIATLTQVESVRKNKKTLVSLALLSLFIWILYPAKMYILALQFASEVGFIQVASITFAAYLVAMIPIFPGGLGGFEGTMSGLLAAMGFALADAAVITISFRFVTFWFPMLLGAAYIAVYKKVLPTFRDL
jgi:uncharacterized protein (TIRG00374 family)